MDLPNQVPVAKDHSSESSVWNQVSQLPQIIAEYRKKAEEFIHSSYIRSGGIDLDCEVNLELLIERLKISPEERITIKNEIIFYY